MSKRNEFLELLCERKEYSVRGSSVIIKEVFPFSWRLKWYFILLVETMGVVSEKRKKTYEVYSVETRRILNPDEQLAGEIKAQLPELADENVGDVIGGFKQKREMDAELERVLTATADKIRWGEAEKKEWDAYLQKAHQLRHESSGDLYFYFRADL